MPVSPSRGLLRDCETSRNHRVPSFQALLPGVPGVSDLLVDVAAVLPRLQPRPRVLSAGVAWRGHGQRGTAIRTVVRNHQIPYKANRMFRLTFTQKRVLAFK